MSEIDKKRPGDFKVYINRVSTLDNYLEKLFNMNINMGNKWEHAVFYALDPYFEIDESGRKPLCKIYVDNPHHFVIRVNS